MDTMRDSREATAEEAGDVRMPEGGSGEESEGLFTSFAGAEEGAKRSGDGDEVSREGKERNIKFEEKERVVLLDPNKSIRPFELQQGEGEDGEAKRPLRNAHEDEDDFTDDEVDYYYEEGKDTNRTYENYGSNYNFLTQMTSRVNKNITNWQWYLRNKRTGGKRSVGASIC